MGSSPSSGKSEYVNSEKPNSAQTEADVEIRIIIDNVNDLLYGQAYNQSTSTWSEFRVVVRLNGGGGGQDRVCEMSTAQGLKYGELGPGARKNIYGHGPDGGRFRMEVPIAQDNAGTMTKSRGLVPADVVEVHAFAETAAGTIEVPIRWSAIYWEQQFR